MSRLFRRDSSGRIFYQHPKAGGLGWEADGRHDELGTRSSGPLGAELPETESRSHHTGPWLRRWSQSGRPAEAVSRRHSRGSGLLLRQREKSERCKLPSHRRGTVPGNPGDVQELPFADDSFEQVTAFETIYFWPNLEEAFQQVFRVLKPGGSFLVCNESNGEDPKQEKWCDIIGGMTIYTGERLFELLWAAGFIQVEIHQREDRNWLCVTAQKP